MIYAGVDIAKADHVIGSIDDAGDEVAKPVSFKNSEAGFERRISHLESIAEGPGDITVAMEATGHYWMACYAYLAARGYAVVALNPAHVKAVRKFKSLSVVKSDRIDPRLIAETLRIGEYDPTRVATDEIRSLKTLTRYRQSLKEQVAGTKIKVACLMDAYFPEYASLFSDMFGATSRTAREKPTSERDCPHEGARSREALACRLPWPHGLREGVPGKDRRQKVGWHQAWSADRRFRDQGASVSHRLSREKGRPRRGAHSRVARADRAAHPHHPRRLCSHRRADRGGDR